jgi:DNA-binding MarR family transcriptional regulator
MQKKSITNDAQYTRKLLGKARRLMLKARKLELEPYNISPRQAAFLAAVNDLGEKATLTELSRYHSRAVNTISSQMTEMENDGFVKKIRISPKTKALRFDLTEIGLIAYNNANKNTALLEIMSALLEKDRKQLNSLLLILINKAEAYNASKGLSDDADDSEPK